ncbi:unnamed protein product, partial [Scytosiphon promiscuus]
KPPGIDTGNDTDFSDSTTAPPSSISSRGDATPDCTTGTGDDAEACGWTRGPEEVCLFSSVWSEWTRTQPRKHGRVRGSGGRRTTTRKNKKRRCPRRRQERRGRRALRRKQMARRARVGGRRRRPPTSFRGGGGAPEEDQVSSQTHSSLSLPRCFLQGTGEETGQSPSVAGTQADPAPPTGSRGRQGRLPLRRRPQRGHNWMENRSETNPKKREGTAPSAKRTNYGKGSMPKLEVVLRGLTEDSKGLPLKNGMFFDRKQLSDLKDDFNIAYMLDPNHIGVALDKTKVKNGGRSLVVKSFDDGEYTLEDDETKIRQWELLECKCGGGVTLDDALRRFILHLVSTQTIMKIHGAPFVRGEKYPEMLWNIRDAIARL